MIDETSTINATHYDEGYGDKPNDMTLKFWKQKERMSYVSTRTEPNAPTMDLFILNGKIRISHKYKYNPTCFSETEALVFKMYAAGTVLTGIEDFDPEDCDLTLKEEY